MYTLKLVNTEDSYLTLGLNQVHYSQLRSFLLFHSLTYAREQALRFINSTRVPVEIVLIDPKNLPVEDDDIPF